MRRFVLCFVLAFSIISTTTGEPPAVQVRVVDPAGKPVAGAKVWVYRAVSGPHAPKSEPTPLVTDSEGRLSIPENDDARHSSQLFVRDAAGRIGSSSTYTRFEQDGDDTVRIVLVNMAKRLGRVTTAEGQPVAGAEVAVTGYYADPSIRRGSGGPNGDINPPEWETKRLTTKTDADGRFELAVPAEGYFVIYRVMAAGQGETRFAASPGVELATKLPELGTLIVETAGVESKWLASLDWHLAPAEPADRPTTGVHALQWYTGTFDADGRFTTRVLPRRYRLTIYMTGKLPAVFEPGEPFAVAAGRETKTVARFSRPATVSGAITDQATGKGIAGVGVFVNVAGDTPNSGKYLFVETDKVGRYTAHGPAGWYTVGLQGYQIPDGYCLPAPAMADRRLVEPARIDVGQSHTFAPIALPKAATLTGRVVLANDQPAAAARIDLSNDNFGSRHGRISAGKDGGFTIKNLPPDDAVALRVRHQQAVNVPLTVDLQKSKEPVSIVVSEANAASFKGRIVDSRGAPIAGARVRLLHHFQNVGRSARYGTIRTLTSTTTDADGRYTFTALWPLDQYHVQVSGGGYAAAEGKPLAGEAGQSQEFPVIKLARATLAVRGTVLGPDGQPVAGAEVFGIDGPERSSSTTTATGQFVLPGFHEGAAFVFARKAGHRFAAVPVTPGGEPVTIKLATTSDPISVPLLHVVALNKFTRHVLTLIWESHAQFGYGRNALRGMARIDLDTAKRWRDEELKRSGGKTDFTRVIDGVVRERTLFDTARNDLDEALALLGTEGADDASRQMQQLGERMIAVDKAKAARLAEEAAVKARQRELPGKVWALAMAGDLAARAGNVDGGKKLLVEATDLAAKLVPDDRGANTYAVGLVADRLAAHDFARAEALLASIKDASAYNRALCSSAGRLAAVDLPKALKLLDRFRPDNTYYPQEARLRIAFAIAREKPDEAARLLGEMKHAPYSALGYARLAVIFAPTDKTRAIKMIDAAFDVLDGQTEEFRGWSSYGGRAGFAAVVTVRAKEIGHPNVAELVARTLAMRPTGREGFSRDQDADGIVNIAAALALVDPAAARHLLATVAAPEEFAARIESQRRDWLFALALADPERAIGVADRLMAKAKAARGGRNALSNTGLVELGTILTAADRLKELAMFGNLPRELGDED